MLRDVFTGSWWAYRGIAPAIVDLRGQVQVIFGDFSSIEYIRPGKASGIGCDRSDALGSPAGLTDRR